jgi:hypothetical protein
MAEPVEDNRCRGLQRYYYDKKSMTCVPFGGIGTCPARGNNKNNFASKTECETACKSHLVESKNSKENVYKLIVLFLFSKRVIMFSDSLE